MEYTMNAGLLYHQSSTVPLARIKCSMLGPNKKIYLHGNEIKLQADIVNLDDTNPQRGNVRNRRYILTNQDGQRVAEAKPEYASGEDPDVIGWPICRLPKVDHATLCLQGSLYLLTMHSDQMYSVKDEKGGSILRITHKGISGGWSVRDDFGFTPDMLCGIFVFCRFLEKENEFLVV